MLVLGLNPGSAPCPQKSHVNVPAALKATDVMIHIAWYWHEDLSPTRLT